MTTGIVVAHAVGKRDKTRLYIKLKNGAVYRHREPLASYQQLELVGTIQFNNYKVRLRDWDKIR